VADRRDEAIALLRRAHAAHLEGELANAAGGYKRALALQPELFDAEYFLAILWLQRDDFGRAVARFAAIVGRGERLPEAAINLGHACSGRGQTGSALAAYRRAASWAPAETEAWIGIGSQTSSAGDLRTAARCFARALAVDPHDALALCNYGGALAGLGRPAGRWHRRSIATAPASTPSWVNVGHDVRNAGDWLAASHSYGRAGALSPGDALVLSETIHADLHLANWGGLSSKLSNLAKAIDRGCAVPPFHLLALDLPAPLKRANAERWCERYSTQPARRGIPRDGRLRLGYLSGDFRRHAVAYEIVDLIESHDRTQVDLYGYGWAAGDGSDVRSRLDRAFGTIENLDTLSDEAAAARIAADDLDVLIDLAGHTHGARPGILALRPVPVQASYFGFPGTTGAGYHDYALVDNVVAPDGHDAFFSEALVRLPGCYWPHDSKPVSVPSPDRSTLGLPGDAIVLACFNQVYKIQPESFGHWMQMLRRAPKAVLWLLDAGPIVAANLRREAAAAGIEADRLIFAPPKPRFEHLARLAAADIVVDTLPYNAHTTASDALTSGCLVVTRIGRDFAGRVCASMLRSVGLDDLVTATADDFVDCVATLANDTRRRGQIKTRLLARLAEGPLFDTGRLCRSIETAAEEMRRRSLAEERPSRFTPVPVE